MERSQPAVDRLTGWYWTSNTVINSVAIGDVDGDGQTEVVTGGYFNDDARNIAQLIEWNGATLAADRHYLLVLDQQHRDQFSCHRRRLMAMDKQKLLLADISTTTHAISAN